MAINFPKWLSLPLIAATLALVLLMPSVALAAPFRFQLLSQPIIAPVVNVVNHYPDLSKLDLTPLQRQQLQAILQRRNKDISAVLNSTQRTQLQQKIHSGNNLNQALRQLELAPEQQQLIQAIEQLTTLKLQATLARYSLPN
ncbi:MULTISPECIES: hypothetical protein [unclassified Anabaena]|uniref:hypothetical protein n=1 Tax=unclassified Anabaena TaxID=2619674 RepID=UPI00082EBD46|nr:MULTISPECIES: hypothetical protein [unclassified Anabaena]